VNDFGHDTLIVCLPKMWVNNVVDVSKRNMTVLTYEVNEPLVSCVKQCILGTNPDHYRASIWRLKELNLPVMLTMGETLCRNICYSEVMKSILYIPCILKTTTQYPRTQVEHNKSLISITITS